MSSDGSAVVLPCPLTTAPWPHANQGFHSSARIYLARAAHYDNRSDVLEAALVTGYRGPDNASFPLPKVCCSPPSSSRCLGESGKHVEVLHVPCCPRLCDPTSMGMDRLRRSFLLPKVPQAV